ncbi:ABC transporter ATP-binding protein [Salinibacterium sp. NK8237]|uniref:ABC transporter ATP-binding protein n=1 Tax=Salinibacterium sp. NK8237 TaxID=2792038 RepID=UPI0018CF2D42|nr:ABC transporter ATP-binding protein [Salinibacterium sp. NK8237]MBH0130098.1 ABC transporter ATP-binding protein [Salinibacterium sp. NK8237]
MLETKPALLEVRHITKTYRTRTGDTLAIGDVNFEAHEGEFVVIVGPSGCGKTTLLRCLTGLDTPTGGEVRFDGSPVDRPREGVGVVFQEYTRSLFPWLSVAANVGFGLSGMPRKEREERVADALRHVGLVEFADSYSWQLSGGMQQRVAIARAIASRPKFLLMDEPFASVDAQTRGQLESLVLDLWKEFKWTVVLVTHDIDEAIFLADRVLVLSTRPSHIVEEIQIDLERPRTHLGTKSQPEFHSHRKRVNELIGVMH